MSTIDEIVTNTRLIVEFRGDQSPEAVARAAVDAVADHIAQFRNDELVGDHGRGWNGALTAVLATLGVRP